MAQNCTTTEIPAKELFLVYQSYQIIALSGLLILGGIFAGALPLLAAVLPLEPRNILAPPYRRCSHRALGLTLGLMSLDPTHLKILTKVH